MTEEASRQSGFRRGASRRRESSAFALHTAGDSIGDLVVLASDEEGVTYRRLRGTLSRNLPAALGKVMQDGGTDAIRDELESLKKEKQ